MRTLSRFLVGLVIAVAVCAGPRAAPFAYIANGGSGNFGDPGVVSVIDTATNAVVATITVGLGPFGVAVDPAGKRVYVTNALGDSLSVIDTATSAVVRTIAVGPSPSGVAVNAVGDRVFVANYDANTVSVIDAATGAVVGSVVVGRTPGGIATSPSGARAYVANYDSSSVSVIEAATNTLIATIAVDPLPVGVAVAPDGGRVYVTTQGTRRVAVIDTSNNAVIATIAVGATPTGVAVNPIGTRLYVANLDSNSVSVINTATNGVVATIGVGAMPAGVAVTPAGTRVYVANNDSGTVSVIDTATNTVIATIAVGELPISLGKFIGPDVVAPTVRNYQGLWWNSPAESESGWGINFAHQGEVIFATWYTYDLAGDAWWLTMSAFQTADNVFSGTLYETTGPAFNAVPFNPDLATRTPVGTGTLTFTDANNGSFAYTVKGIAQTKAITRQVWGVLPTCAWGAQPNLTLATNYQDLWWVTSGAESGWGVNFTHQNDTIFATWFTYDFDGTPLWLSATTFRTGTGVYSGDLIRTRGPPFNAVPFDKNLVTRSPVGTLTLTFANGNAASYAYTVMLPGTSPVTQTKHVTRQVFRAPGTVCQ